MTGPDLAALREKAEKATPGPWRVAPGTLTRVDGHRAFVASTFFSVGALDQLYANAAYVASVSPDVLLAVLDRLAQAEAESERLREALTELHAASRDFILRRRIEGILAGSPAENEEQQ